MTTRMTYSKLSDTLIGTPKFLVNKSTVLFATISTTDFVYRIYDQNLSLLITGQCSSLRQAKVNTKARLKELGVKFYDEIRDHPV